MAGEVTVDALPYYDQGYDEVGVKEAVSFYQQIIHVYKSGLIALGLVIR